MVHEVLNLTILFPLFLIGQLRQTLAIQIICKLLLIGKSSSDEQEDYMEHYISMNGTLSKHLILNQAEIGLHFYWEEHITLVFYLGRPFFVLR